MDLNHKENWLAELREFLESDINHVTVPQSLFTQIKHRLFPNPWAVFGKIAFIHTIVGLLSLAVCSQFGLNPFRTDFSLSDWFMKIGGHEFCMSLCGVLFIATTYLLSNFFLSFEELESVKRHLWLQCGVLSLASLTAFYFFGAELVTFVTLLWLVGAIIGGVVSVKSSYYIRRTLIT